MENVSIEEITQISLMKDILRFIAMVAFTALLWMLPDYIFAMYKELDLFAGQMPGIITGTLWCFFMFTLYKNIPEIKFGKKKTKEPEEKVQKYSYEQLVSFTVAVLKAMLRTKTVAEYEDTLPHAKKDFLTRRVKEILKASPPK